MTFGRGGADVVWTLLERRAELPERQPWLTVHAPEAPPLELSAGQVRGAALSVAQTLHRAGVGVGDRVAVLSRNSAEYVVALFGLARIGATFVPLNWLLTPPELAFQLNDAGAVALVTEPDGAARLDAAAEVAGWSGPRFSLGGATGVWSPLDNGDSDAATLPPVPDPDGVFEILYTSGSTSHPKGVMLSQRSVVLTAHRMRAEWSLRPDDVFLTPLPLFHVNAQLMSLLPSLAAGARLILQRTFSASEWFGQVRSTRATVVPLIGTQVRMLMAQPESPDDAENDLRFMPYGLNVPMEMWTAFERRVGAPLINTYGLTEGVGAVTTSPLYEDRRAPSVGRVHLDRRIGVFDENDTPLVGRPGEIRLQGVPGATLMVGYHNRPDLTAEALRDGWLHTGDVGVLDADGYLTYVDRAKDIIKRGGENVSTLEVENVLMAHPHIAEAAVLGRPDPIRDEEVVAFVVPVAGGAVDPDEVRAYCAERLARFKVPTELRVIGEMPRTTIGKLEKKALRALLVAEAQPSPASR